MAGGESAIDGGARMAHGSDDRKSNQCVFVIGPEGSGSKLAARLCADALGIRPFSEWDGDGWCEGESHKVLHRSLPYGDPPRFPDIGQWVALNEGKSDLYFVLTTRDQTLSEYSRLSRFPKSLSQLRSESEHARASMAEVMRGGQKYFIWSYESFMLLGADYLEDLHRFLGAESGSIPRLADGNAARIARGWVGRWHVIRSVCERYARSLRSRLRR